MNLFSSSGQCFTHDGNSDLASWVLELPWWIFTPALQCFLILHYALYHLVKGNIKKRWWNIHWWSLTMSSLLLVSSGIFYPCLVSLCSFFIILLFQVKGPCQHFMQSLFARKEFSWVLLIWDFIYLWWLRDDLGDVDSQLTASSKAHGYT